MQYFSLVVHQTLMAQQHDDCAQYYYHKVQYIHEHFHRLKPNVCLCHSISDTGRMLASVHASHLLLYTFAYCTAELTSQITCKLINADISTRV